MSKTKDEIQLEALAAIGDRRMAGVDIGTGVGKTAIGLEHMRRQYTDIKKFLVVYPSQTIRQSWIDDAKKFNLEYLLECITFTTYRSLTKHDYDYDYIYLDECHSLKAIHNKWLYGYLQQGGRILGLTGTYPVHKNTEKGKMCNFYCPKVYTYSPDDAIEDEILNDYEIYVHEINLNKKGTIPKTGVHGDFMSSEANDYKYWTEALDNASNPNEEQRLAIQRMKVLQSFKTKEHYTKLLLAEQTDKTIVFANTQEQADLLCSHSYHSSNDQSKANLESFKKGEITKISAVEQLSEGVNIPNLKVGIILHAYGNNRKSSQRIGRLLRLNPNDKATIHILCYIDTVDKQWVTAALKSFNQSKIHWIKPKFFEGLHY